jgi:hypothetical protein
VSVERLEALKNMLTLIVRLSLALLEDFFFFGIGLESPSSSEGEGKLGFVSYVV